jgi:hypothetical protein
LLCCGINLLDFLLFQVFRECTKGSATKEDVNLLQRQALRFLEEEENAWECDQKVEGYYPIRYVPFMLDR